MIRVLLIDDHASFRELLALRLAIESDLDVVAEVGSLAEARALLQEAATGADVALVDLDLPDGSGVDLVRDIRATNPDAVVVVLTASLDQHRHAEAVAAGASGVVGKTVSPAEIVAAIRRASAGEPLMSPRDAIELLRLADRQREAERAAQQTVGQLTAREREILGLLAEGLGDEAIAERLFLSPKTVRNQMTVILDKLGVDSRLQALVVAARHGVVRLS